MRGGVTRKDAEGLHMRLVWLLAHGDLTRADIAAGVGRNKGTITPWFATQGWALPDARGLMGLLRVCRISGDPVSARWLLCGNGAPVDDSAGPGPLYYRGAQVELAELELWIQGRRARLRAEEDGATAPDSAAAAGRVAETDRVLEAQKKKKKRGRQAG